MKPETIYYHALNLATQNNYRLMAELKGKFQTWTKAWYHFKNPKSIPKPETEWHKIETSDLHLILLEDKDYPSRLREIPYPPFGIYVLGRLDQINQPSLAIVGTRKASETGKELAKSFAGSLAASAINIVSGLALGIDASAHLGALEAHGKTFAVLGNGLSEIYPKTNEKLAKKIIASSGAIISEYPPGMPSLPHHFIQRNRIVSGLSQGVLVIEAPEKSGALATASFALDQNREVFVIPGPIHHPNFKGSNELIRGGATLITKFEHILEVLMPTFLAQNQKQTADLFSQNKEEGIIVSALSNSSNSLDIDKIIELTKLDANVVNRTLSFLIIKNIVKETDKGYTL